MLMDQKHRAATLETKRCLTIDQYRRVPNKRPAAQAWSDYSGFNCTRHARCRAPVASSLLRVVLAGCVDRQSTREWKNLVRAAAIMAPSLPGATCRHVGRERAASGMGAHGFEWRATAKQRKHGVARFLQQLPTPTLPP